MRKKMTDREFMEHMTAADGPTARRDRSRAALDFVGDDMTRAEQDARDAVSLPRWFWIAAVAVVALVSAASHIWPWGFA